MNLKKLFRKNSALCLSALMLLLSVAFFSTMKAYAADGWPEFAVEMNLGAEIIDSMKETDYHGAIEGVGGNNVVNLSRKSANYKFTRMKKPFVIP